MRYRKSKKVEEAIRLRELQKEIRREAIARKVTTLE